MRALLIRNGTVIDGSATAKPMKNDVLIKSGRIAEVGKDLHAPNARTIDASGLIVAPGFIDAHSHSDSSALIDSQAQGRIFDGVTTEINGTCGLSLFPLKGPIADARRAQLKDQGIEADWKNAGEYFEQVEEFGSAINRGFLVGHGAVRGAVMGYAAKRASRNDLKKMEALVQESIEQGALGLSSGLCYPPGCFGNTAELAALCRHLKGRPYCTHMRNEGRGLLRSLREAMTICRRGNVPLHVSHVKTFGRSNWWKIDALERTLFNAQQEGLDITADRYPYTAAMTDLSTIFPDRLMAGGAEKALERLRTPSALARLKFEVAHTRRKLIWDQIMIAVARDGAEEFQGMTVAEVAETLGMPGIDAVVELLVRARLRVTAIFFEMSETNLERILKWPFVCIGSDSSARSLTGPTATGRPHPRTFGSCTRFLGEYVLKRRLLTLPEGISRLTDLPAKRFGLNSRGRIHRGYFADITIFDSKKICDAATYAKPFALSEGVRWVLVNGTPILDNGKLSRSRPGHVLRSGALS